MRVWTCVYFLNKLQGKSAKEKCLLLSFKSRSAPLRPTTALRVWASATPTHDHDVDVGQDAAVAVGRFALVDGAVLLRGAVEHHRVVQHSPVVLRVVWQRHTHTHHQHIFHRNYDGQQPTGKLEAWTHANFTAGQILRHVWMIITVWTCRKEASGIAGNKLSQQKNRESGALIVKTPGNWLMLQRELKSILHFLNAHQFLTSQGSARSLTSIK